MPQQCIYKSDASHQNENHLWAALQRIVRALMKVMTPLSCYLLLARKQHYDTHVRRTVMPFDS